MGLIFEKIEKPEDIRKYSCIIRDEMLKAKNIEELEKLKKHADYFCAFTHSKVWEKRLGSIIKKMREVAVEENDITVKLANFVAKAKKWDIYFVPCTGEAEEIEERLKNMPQEVINEIEEFASRINLSSNIVEDLKNHFCEIRKAMVLVGSPEELKKLKEETNVLVAITHLQDFKNKFSSQIDEIQELMAEEEKKTIEVANIVAKANNWDLHFEIDTLGQIKEHGTAEEYLEKTLTALKVVSDAFLKSFGKYVKNIKKKEKENIQKKEEEPQVETETEKIIWIMYHKDGEEKVLKKKVKLPATAKNIKIEGPDYFVNKSGNKVWGVKLSYESKISRDGSETWVKRTRIIPFATNVHEANLEN
jgi:hypothetical protein